MKITLLAAASLIAVSSASAQTVSSGSQASSRLDIFGLAPNACVLSPPIAASGANASFTALGGQTGVIRFTQFVDPRTAQPRGASISLAFPVVCNSAHRITVRTDGRGLARIAGAAPAAGFRDRLDYQVSADWAGLTASGSSDAPIPIDLRTTNGAAGQVNLLVDVAGGGAPLVAGDYASTLTVELEASN